MAALEPLVANAAEILQYLEAACRGSAVVLAGDGRCGKTALAQRVTLCHLAAGGSVVVIDLRGDLAVGLRGALPRGPAHFRDYRTAALNLLNPDLFPNLQWVTETLAGAFWGGSRIPAETGGLRKCWVGAICGSCGRGTAGNC